MSKELNLLDIKELASFLVSYFDFYEDPITQLKLQKLLYFIQGWHLAYFDCELFKDEPEAWVKGTVYRRIYSAYGSRGYAILLPNSKNKIKTESEINKKLSELGCNKEQTELIKAVLKKYGNMTTSKLVLINHLHEPWINARKNLDILERGNRVIKNESIKKYFKKFLK